MADYREISQEYAKQGINTAFLLNGSAAFAVMTQFMNIKHELASAVSIGLVSWAIGTGVAAITWLLAFFSTRYVDRSEREAKKDELRNISNYFMYAAVIFFIGSIACFGYGCFIMSNALEKL